ncbi:RNA-binding KH domain-containing protein PEPPER [Camellia lanceoleosa]|uniref:RNA-binding KH domain-containing protein PEPPER n=1 Tax=Camellia lanceoleosa TaxID=1840588 RepID=A0ACC0IDU4_9ERIC|nr:RNA-binding KH domain-containing protein PEPPER [Camellia lanceoleosa]
MAQPGETLTFPKPPAPADPYRSVTGKRPREDGGDALYGEFRGGDAPSPKRRVKSAMDIIFRIIVPSKQIGKVIGKVGSRIQKIREETKATIKIADAISRHEDRVIIISSKDSDNTISDAENALRQIASLILKDDDGNLEALKVGAGHVAANTIRLLIAGSQAGGLIGISGQNIEKLRISSGATITVLAQSQLPLCASAHESDRVVQLSGDVSAENPPKQVVQLNPTYNLAFNRPPQQYVDPTSADYVTLEMMVSETIVGGLIGRCGSNISRIRSESGAAIKVYGGKGVEKHRQIHIGGSAQQVALAKQRVDEYVYSQLIQAAGAQQAIDPTAGMITALAPFFTSSATDQVPAYPGMPSFHTPQL